jgi:hypothetical protein
LIKSYGGREIDNQPTFVCLALFVVKGIEEIKPIISLVSDRSGFGLELGYEGISGMRGDGILVLDFDRII